MVIEFLWAMAGLVVSFLVIVIVGYHILIKLLPKTTSASVLVRVLMLTWLAAWCAGVLFIPLMSFITPGGDTNFVITVIALIIIAVLVVGSYFTRKKGA